MLKRRGLCDEVKVKFQRKKAKLKERERSVEVMEA